MSKDKLIVSQVAFKGAIDLAVAGKIEVDMITSATDAYAKHIWDNFGVEDYKQVSYPPKAKSSGGGEPRRCPCEWLPHDPIKSWKQCA